MLPCRSSAHKKQSPAMTQTLPGLLHSIRPSWDDPSWREGAPGKIIGTLRSKIMRILSRVALALILTPSVWAQTPTQTIAAPVDKTVEVSPSQSWTDSTIDLHPGDLVEISATTVGTGSGLCN